VLSKCILLCFACFYSKLRYLYAETFGELSYYMWGTFDFWVTLVVYLIALWIRMYLHYIGEYLYLLVRIFHYGQPPLVV
jgi:hypothetical protein